MSVEPRSVAGDLTWGALAGSLATLALSGMSRALYTPEPRLTKLREQLIRGNKGPNRIAVERMAQAAGVDLSASQATAAEAGLHFSVGAGAGAVYGAIRHHVPAPAITRALGFGLSLWLIADEGINPALGLTYGPKVYPWQAHVRGLASHLVFGLATEGLLTVADRYRNSR